MKRADMIAEALKEVNETNLALVYAMRSNELSEEADAGDDEEYYEFLKEYVDVLKFMIVQQYMNDKGWYRNSQDDLERWTRD